MKKFLKTLAFTGTLSILLVGCGINHNANDRFTGDENDPLHVRYEPGGMRHETGWNTRSDLTYRNNIDRNNWDQMGTNVRHYGRDNVDGNMNVNHRQNDFSVADEIAEDVTKLDNVDRAYVFIMGDNAYVAVQLNDSQRELNARIEGQIANQARKANRNIDNVFVSANPDFYNRMRGFNDDIQAGNPIDGLFNEFTETIERIFPTSR